VDVLGESAEDDPKNLSGSIEIAPGFLFRRHFHLTRITELPGKNGQVPCRVEISSEFGDDTHASLH
jgi:hypothetical protein